MTSPSMQDAVSADASTASGLDALMTQVGEAVANKTQIWIRAGNTKSWYGHRVEGADIAVRVDVRAHAGIVDYDPSELVIVARAGTALEDIEALLARHGQMLPFEPPHFAPQAASRLPRESAKADDTISRARGATLGGCIAAGLSGPRRMAAGAVRDFVLGARVIDGRGQHLSFGGRVMKNVAGYDVSRALAGSLGTLGVITEVALKVLPRPVQTTTLSLEMNEESALDKLNAWGGMPVAITASAWRPKAAGARSGRLMVRLEGGESAVQSGIRRIGGLDVDQAEAAAFWIGLREQNGSFFAARPPGLPLWRVALASTAPPLNAASLGFDDQLIEWGGALRWIATLADGGTIREAASSLGGHAILWRGSDAQKSQHGVFAPLSAPLMAIHRRLKTEFDPDRLFNRGRMYPEL
ncbi:MAG: glycolate oxidase subunit GlcE [Burkholderiaceae bacterium]